MDWCGSGSAGNSGLRKGDLKNKYLVEFESKSRSEIKVEMEYVGYGMYLVLHLCEFD